MAELGKYELKDNQLTATGWKTKLRLLVQNLNPRFRRQSKFLLQARHLAHEKKPYLVIQADPLTDIVVISKSDKVVVLQMAKGYTKKAVKYHHERFADYLLQAIDSGMKSLAGKS